MRRGRFPAGIALIPAIVLFTLGCSAGPASSGAATTHPATTRPATAGPATAGSTAAAGPTTVDVTLKEFAVGTDVNTAPAGDVKFAITNQGPDDQHEFVVIKTDLSLIDLPTKENGSVDEEAEGIDVIDEVEEMDVGANEELAVNLAPGAYVLICNIFDEAENEAHYQEGMRTSFTVTE